MKLLMIEDNKSVSEMMSMFFEKENWEVTFAYDGNEAIELFQQDPASWNVITLDLNLPGKDGMEVAITLIARIKALYRHEKNLGQKDTSAGTQNKEFDVQTSTFKLSSSTREAFLLDRAIPDLTPKEFDLLKTLAAKPKQVFSREQLLQHVWGYDYFGDERTVDAHIKKLRQKVEKVGPQVIQTVWGVGYKFDDSDVQVS